MKILVVDDEPLAQQRLKQLLIEISSVNTVYLANNGLQAIDACQIQNPDLVLMDIRMPGMDGLEAAQHISQMDNPPAIIFTTAYDEYALKAFDVSAVGYLLKPVRSEALAKTIVKAKKLNQVQLSAIKSQHQGRSNITAKISGNVKLIPIKDILFFQAEQKYVTVKYLKGETIIEDTLKELQKEFSNQFIRVHRNAIVAKKYIKGIHRDNKGHAFVVIGEDQLQLEISRRHMAEIKKLMNEL